MNDEQRRLQALRLGRMADCRFEIECRRRGLDPGIAVLAPIGSIVGTRTATEEQA
jgi:hypothetical protein